MKQKNQSKKPLKGKRRHKMLPSDEVQLDQNLQNTRKKSCRNKNSKTRKKPQESNSKTKSSEEKINSDPNAPKMATSSSSQLKLVPEKLKKYLTEQDGASTLAARKLMFLFQENPERNIGIEKKDKFVRSIV